MSWVSVGVTAVGAIGSYAAGRQKAPAQAAYQPVDVGDESAKAIAANNANFGAASNLAAKTNDFNQSQAAALLEKAIPGFGALQSKLLGQVNSDLGNQTNLPPDVQSKIAQYAAEKGVTRGTSGNFNGFSLIKDFGFNLTDYQNASRARALSTLSSVFGMAPRVSPMSPMSMMVDPNTAINVAGQNHQMQYNVDQAGNNAQAAADNYNRTLAAGSISSIGSSFAGAYAKQLGAGGVKPPSFVSPQPKATSSLSLMGSYTPLANATPFKMPGA